MVWVHITTFQTKHSFHLRDSCQLAQHRWPKVKNEPEFSRSAELRTLVAGAPYQKRAMAAPRACLQAAKGVRPRQWVAELMASEYLAGKDQPLCLSVFWNELTGSCKTKSFQYFQLMMENYCLLQPNQHILKLSSLPGHTSHKTLPTPKTRGSVKDLQRANII